MSLKDALPVGLALVPARVPTLWERGMVPAGMSNPRCAPSSTLPRASFLSFARASGSNGGGCAGSEEEEPYGAGGGGSADEDEPGGAGGGGGGNVPAEPGETCSST